METKAMAARGEINERGGKKMPLLNFADAAISVAADE